MRAGSRIFSGDLGYSYISRSRLSPRSAASRSPRDWRLALVFSILLGVPLGVISAVRQNTALTMCCASFPSAASRCLPSGSALILMGFVAMFGTIPIYSAERNRSGVAADVRDARRGRRLPQLAPDHAADPFLDARGAAPDYIRTARSKGASDGTVNYHHALRNAILPVIT